MINYHIVTIFPELCKPYFEDSILGKAADKNLLKVHFYNPKDFIDKEPGTLGKRVDDKPFGGGPGMVLRLDPVLRAVKKAVGSKKNVQIVYFSPWAQKFTTEIAKDYATKYSKKKIKHFVFVCGRYEGIDSRISEIMPGVEYSIGDYVLTGGELPAMVMIDCISRQIPGVLGDADSREEERTAGSKFYTRPAVYRHKGKDYKVPDVLTSGNHAEIDEWRKHN